MSTIIMSQCWPLGGMSAAQKAVLISLADQSNDDGVCWPSVGTISKRTCLSERAVQEALQWLQVTGAVFREYKANSSTVYTVTPSRFDPAKAPAPRIRTKGEPSAPPAPNAPPAPSAPPPAGGAPLGVQEAHPTPAGGAPKSSLNRNGTINEPSFIGADAPKAKKPAARATVLPDDFWPNETAEQMARDFGVSLAEQLAAFQDHHSAKGSTFKDWQAAFRNWLRNSQRFGQRVAAMTPNRRDEPVETYAQRAARQRMEEVAPGAARKVPGQLSGFERAQAFMNGADVIDVTPTVKQIGE